MTELLYIDGTLADLGQDTKITLNFKSNLLGDISQITASNSQTITLPKTPTNRRIFGNAAAPSANAPQRYTKLPARYLRDGIEVVKAGYIVLLSASDTYEVALYWGLMTEFEEWVNSEATIGDVCDNLTTVWTNATPLSTSSSNTPLVWADYFNGVGSYGQMGNFAESVALHPFVRASYILGQISSQFGITFDYPSEIGEQLAKMGVLCSTRNATYSVTNTSGVSLNTYGSYLWTDWLGGVQFVAGNSAYYTLANRSVQYVVSSRGMATCIKPTITGVLTLNVGLLLTAEAYQNSPRAKVVVLKVSKSGKCTPAAEVPSSWSGSKLFAYPLPISVEVGEGESVAIAVYSQYTRVVLNSASITFSAFQEDSTVEVPYGGTFYANDNLPNISTVQFVKDICAMLGLQAMPDASSPTTIRLLSLGELDANKAQALDWSDRLIDAGEGEPSAISFALDGYATRNLFSYSNDEGVTDKANGTLLANSDTLDNEAEIVSLKFSGTNEMKTEGGEVLASIPLYSAEQNNEGTNEAKLQSVGPRIVQFANITASPNLKAIAAPLYWPNLLSQYYPTLQAMLTNAVVIEEDMRLTAADLKELDFTRPIYLAQYGRYYALESVQSEAEDVCRVSLVQLGTGVVNNTVERIYLVDADYLDLYDSNDLQLTARLN